MKFRVFCAHTGRSLLPEGRLLDAPTQAAAYDHFLEEMDGQFTRHDIRVEEAIPFRLRKPRKKTCQTCGYEDLTGADKCPGCGYDAQPDTDDVEQETG